MTCASSAHSGNYTPLIVGERFQVFSCGNGEWCARRADGLVGGYFVDRECALRFVRREMLGKILSSLPSQAADGSRPRIAA
jgi:hypothetical protein